MREENMTGMGDSLEICTGTVKGTETVKGTGIGQRRIEYLYSSKA
jgi:hypothetical protein